MTAPNTLEEATLLASRCLWLNSPLLAGGIFSYPQTGRWLSPGLLSRRMRRYRLAHGAGADARPNQLDGLGSCSAGFFGSSA